MSKKTQCQFAEDALDKPRCEKPATRKWGDHWFCEKHGARQKEKKDDNLDEMQFMDECMTKEYEAEEKNDLDSGEMPCSPTSFGGGWMRRLVRPLLSATSIAALMWCAWMAVNGSEGSGRILQFAAWFMAITIVGAVWPREFGDLRQKGMPLPKWIHVGTGIALILFLVWHGWIWTAIALVLHEIGTASIYRTNADVLARGESATPTTPKPQ